MSGTRSTELTTLTPEQRQEIQRAGEEPVRLADPEIQTEHVILRPTSTSVSAPWPMIRGPPSPSR